MIQEFIDEINQRKQADRDYEEEGNKTGQRKGRKRGRGRGRA